MLLLLFFSQILENPIGLRILRNLRAARKALIHNTESLDPSIQQIEKDIVFLVKWLIYSNIVMYLYDHAYQIYTHNSGNCWLRTTCKADRVSHDQNHYNMIAPSFSHTNTYTHTTHIPQKHWQLISQSHFYILTITLSNTSTIYTVQKTKEKENKICRGKLN